VSRNSADAECITCKRTFKWDFTEPRACPPCMRPKAVLFKNDKVVDLNAIEIKAVRHTIIEVFGGSYYKDFSIEDITKSLIKERDRVVQAGGNYYGLMDIEDLGVLIERFRKAAQG
jgi:hypothetical protein